MKPYRMHPAWRTVLALLAMGGFAFGAGQQQKEGRVTVAVAVVDIEPIVRAVGGGQVDTVNLFKGCILRKDLQVEPASKARLATAEAVVWTGFMNESAAVSDVLRTAGSAGRKGGEPKWIDVSKGTVRTNQPTSTCFGSVDPAFASGDLFFWLNPENGGLIARNIARGLGELRPSSRAMFMANAEAFQRTLAKDIQRWKTALKPLHGVKVFTAQCGWQNFSSMGGPSSWSARGLPASFRVRRPFCSTSSR